MDILKISENTLLAVCEWHSQLVTHAFKNIFFISSWPDYVLHDVMGIKWTKNHVSNDTYQSRDLMSKMIHTFLLCDQVIIHTLNLSSLILNAGGCEYQEIYNILVKYHSNLTACNKVQVLYPNQGNNDTFVDHVKYFQK